MPEDSIQTRRIRAFIVDDDDPKLPWSCEVDIYRPADGGVSKESSASGWLPHIRDIYRNKRIAFDLLSIDVFFKNDETDPVHRLPRPPGEPPASADIATGLLHGLTAMARRENVIEGNVMPLSWEVRTVSPDKEGLTSDQWADVTRTYGLLLALMTPYRPGAGILGFGMQLEPAIAVRQAFKDQDRREGAALGLPGLLVDWRAQFIDKVKTNEISIDVANLRPLQSLDPQKLLARKDAYVALVGRRGVICDRIQLSSIFTDLALKDKPVYGEVIKWILQLLDIVDDLLGFADDTKRWVEYLARRGRILNGKEALGAITSDEAPDCWEPLSPVRQSLALIVYRVASNISPDRFPAFTSQEQLFFDTLRVTNFNPHTIERMFGKAQQHVYVKNATELQSQFIDKLVDPGLTPPFSPLFARTLAKTLEKLDLVGETKLRCPVIASLFDDRE